MAILEPPNQHLIHSNIRIPRATWLERILVTPRDHFVHHDSRAEIAHSNYGFIFSVWDRLFGTHVDPEAVPVDAALGLSYEISRWRLLLSIGPTGSPVPATWHASRLNLRMHVHGWSISEVCGAATGGPAASGFTQVVDRRRVG